MRSLRELQAKLFHPPMKTIVFGCNPQAHLLAPLAHAGEDLKTRPGISSVAADDLYPILVARYDLQFPADTNAAWIAETLVGSLREREERMRCEHEVLYACHGVSASLFYALLHVLQAREAVEMNDDRGKLFVHNVRRGERICTVDFSSLSCAQRRTLAA